MAKKVIDISKIGPADFPLFFFDTNVWIAILKYFGSIQNNPREEAYLKLFESIVEMYQTNSIYSKSHLPKIVLTSVLFSEIITTYLRKIAMPRYFNKEDCSGIDYKSAYRDNPLSDYKNQLQILKDDLKCFKEYTKLFSDEFDKIDPFGWFNQMPLRIDFNDFYFNKLFSNTKICIVTDDIDFYTSEMTVVTNNRKLLSRK